MLWEFTISFAGAFLISSIEIISHNMFVLEIILPFHSETNVKGLPYLFLAYKRPVQNDLSLQAIAIVYRGQHRTIVDNLQY